MPAAWTYNPQSHVSCSSDFIIVTEVVIPSLTDDEMSEWYYMTGGITAFKKFVTLRFSKALQFYLRLPLSISDDSAFLGLRWDSWTVAVLFDQIIPRPVHLSLVLSFYTVHYTTETVESVRLPRCMQLFGYYFLGCVYAIG